MNNNDSKMSNDDLIFRNNYFDENNDESRLSDNIENDLIIKLSKLSSYLRNTKSLLEKQEIENIMKEHFKKLMKHSLVDLEKVRVNKMWNLLVCCFIDILRISAPEIPFQNDIMEFYLNILIKWLTNEKHIYIEEQKQTTFFYVLHQIAKLSVLSLLFTTDLIDKIPFILEKFFYFLDKKIYPQQQYHDFLDTISSTVSEYSDAPSEVYKLLMKYLYVDKKNGKISQVYDISYNVIKINKSILGNKIRDFIIPCKEKSMKAKKSSGKKGDYKKNECESELFFKKYNYLKILKELSKISPDFLLKILSELNNDGFNQNKQYFGHNCFDILRKILSNPNSLEIFRFWKSLCNNFFTAIRLFNNNNFKDKFLIFKCAVKFVTRNDIDRLKQENIYSFIIETITFFFRNLLSESQIEKSLLVLKKTMNYSLISLCLVSILTSKNKNKQIILSFYFDFLNENIFKNFILQNFKDKKYTKILNELSEVFTTFLLANDNIIKEYSKDNKIDLNIQFKNFIKNIKKTIDNKELSIIIILMIYFYMSLSSPESSILWYSFLHLHFIPKRKDSNSQEWEPYDIDNDINKINFNFEVDDPNNNIISLIEFFNQYIIFVDENSNPDSLKVLLSILFTFELFLCNIHFSSDSVSDSNKEIILLILRKSTGVVIKNNITNKSVFDIICKILLLIIHLTSFLENENDERIKIEINQILFNDMSDFVFKNDKINPKYFAKLICDFVQMMESLKLKKIKNFELVQQNIIIPDNFISLLKTEKYINCLKFVNVLFYFDIEHKFSSVYFTLDLGNFILGHLKESIVKRTENNKKKLKDIFEELNNSQKSNKNEYYNFEEKEKLEMAVKTELIINIKFFSEILKYEINYYINNNLSIDEKNENIKKFVKRILDELLIILDNNIEQNSTEEKEILSTDSSKEKISLYKKDKKSNKIENKSKIKNDRQKIIVNDFINITYIKNYIDLIFYMGEIGVLFSFRKLIKISNIIIYKETRIRKYFIIKVRKSLLNSSKSHRNLIRLYSIMLLGLFDPCEDIEKLAKETLHIFLNLLLIKMTKYRNKGNNFGYIYVPEFLFSYLIVFFIFNDNLNIYYQLNDVNNENDSKNNKCFSNLFIFLLKEIKKKFGFIDSTFLLQELDQMKKYECIDIKKIKCLEQKNVYFENIINNKTSEISKGVNFDNVKNSLINNLMSVVYNDYLSDLTRNEVKGFLPQIPNILTGKDKEMKNTLIYNLWNMDEYKEGDISKNNNNELTYNEYNFISPNQSNKFDSIKLGKNGKISFNEYFQEGNEYENL